MPFALPMSDPLTLTLAAVLADANPLAELLAVMLPVNTTVPVLALLTPAAVDAVTLPVIVTVPVLAFVTPELALLFPPVTFPVSVTEPVKVLVIPSPFVDVPIPPVTFPVTKAVAAPVDTFKVRQ